MKPQLETDHLVDHVSWYLREDGGLEAKQTERIIAKELASLRRLSQAALEGLRCTR